MTIVDGADAISANFGHLASLPASYVKAGYTTGSGGVPWTSAQFSKYPSAIRIDQDPNATDTTADILDFESGAATLNHLAPWVKAATANYNSVKRPGQRKPAIYCSQSSITAVANALIAAGINECPIWMAHYGIGRPAAVNVLNGTGGPFPIIGVQYSDTGGGGTYDQDVFLSTWLNAVSAKAAPKSQVPPGQWLNPSQWTWVTATLAGKGLDGKNHEFDFNPSTGAWARKS